MVDKYNSVLIVLQHIDKYYKPIFLCLCILGNTLSICVFCCTKLRYNSSRIYLCALAISDIGVLVTVFINWFKMMKIINFEYWMTLFLISSQNLFLFLSVWIVVAFTVQRYIAIKWPLLRRSLYNVNRARNVIGLAGLAFLYSISWFILGGIKLVKSNANEDKTNLILWSRILITIRFIITLIIPAMMIAIFNALIMYNMRKQNRIRRNLILSSTVSNENTRSSDNEASHIEVTKLLVIISSLVICLYTPIQSVELYIIYTYNCDSYCIHVLYISDLLCLTNYGIRFVLYWAMRKNFRTEWIRMFTKSSDTRRNEDMEMDNYMRNNAIDT